MLKSILRRGLLRLGVYDWLKEDTVVSDLYRNVRDGTPLNWRSREVDFYRKLLEALPRPLLIFDIGAHRGRTTAAFRKLGARVVAVEPDEMSRKHLARRYGNPKSAVTIVGMAASDTERRDTLWVAKAGAGTNTLSEKWVATLRSNPDKLGIRSEFLGKQPVSTTTLDALIDAHGLPHYIKIDVEGHEAAVLRGLSRPVPIVSFEANLPEFRPEAAECVGFLERLAPEGRFNLTLGDAHHGLALAEWQPAPKLVGLLGALDETTVEIYWKPVPIGP